jgi:serine/threonine-protein kinase
MQRDRIGRYEIIYPIAQGGMAEVFVGRLPGMAGFEKLVAIKLIHAHLCKEQQFIQMFLDEARLAASIRHPNVAEIFEVGREGDLYFMIAELVLGQDLHALMRRTRQAQTPFPEGLSSHIVSQVCLGLHEAHEQKDKDGKPLGLVHRDVTPRNILLSYGGYAKLADFGVAWAQNRLGHSEAGSLKGKVGFISPEQIRNEPVDRRCDIFSLGVVFYMMLTGRHPFQGDNDAATMNNILAGAPVRPSEVNPEISPGRTSSF